MTIFGFRCYTAGMTKYTLFISDLHIDEAHPAQTEAFFKLLQNEARSADALYILGDLFEVWIGDDDHSEYNDSVIRELRALSDTGTPVYFMAGNRDFLINKRFAKATGIKILKDPSVIKLYSKSILLMHGDSLCLADKRHQKSRKRMHNRLYQWLVVTFLPLAFRRLMAKKYRENSTHRKRTIDYEIMDVTPGAAEAEMNRFNVDLLIHGHTHRPAIHDIKLENRNGKRIVLGAWHNVADILLYPSDHQYKILNLRCQS